MPRLIAIVLVLVLRAVSVFGDYNRPCFTRPTRPIPPDHLMATKTKPLVIGHRGNRMKYQENTLDGIKSLLDTNADGFEVDVYLTKDKKLVAFHDDNAKMLTGVNKTVWESTADELTKLNVKRNLTIGGEVKDYGKPRPISLLEDILKAMKDSGKLMLLEIKPNGRRDKEESETAGRTLAKLVTDLGLVKQAIITSLDPWKSLAAYQENPDVVTGFFYHPSYCDQSRSPELFKIASQLSGMGDCLKTEHNDTEFFKGMYKYGDVVKAINASCMDMVLSWYDNSKCFDNTFKNLHQYYSPTISVGALSVYSMSLSQQELAAQDVVVDRLVKQGVQRLVTDNIDHALTRLGRPLSPTSPSPKAMATREIPSVLVLIITCIAMMLWV